MRVNRMKLLPLKAHSDLCSRCSESAVMDVMHSFPILMPVKLLASASSFQKKSVMPPEKRRKRLYCAGGRDEIDGHA